MDSELLKEFFPGWPLVFLVIEIIGILSAAEAVYLAKSSQGAVAWGISLIAFPLGALPLYWIFGHSRFKGYKIMLDEFVEAHMEKMTETRKHLRQEFSADASRETASAEVFERIADGSFLALNDVSILKNGVETFNAIYKAVAEAKLYVLCSFYIVRDDNAGREFKQQMIAASKRGVKVYVLYDAIGCYKLPDEFFDELLDEGVRVIPFDTVRGPGSRFQINFRNHRKILVMDGQHAFIGGHNVGDEYMGENPIVGFWRDTQIHIHGPAAISVQAAFFSDWLWAADEKLPLMWQPKNSGSDKKVLVTATGPADILGRCRLFFLEAINSARKRLWIASPYFVPDEAVIDALQLAALRGVDVRLLLPAKPDHRMVWLASFSYIPEVCRFGVRVFQYQKGFLHQKVMVVDDGVASVGTANLDNRSFSLNFEIIALVADREFNREATSMLEADFADSEEIQVSDFSELGLTRRIGARIARLLAPVL